MRPLQQLKTLRNLVLHLETDIQSRLKPDTYVLQSQRMTLASGYQINIVCLEARNKCVNMISSKHKMKPIRTRKH